MNELRERSPARQAGIEYGRAPVETKEIVPEVRELGDGNGPDSIESYVAVEIPRRIPEKELRPVAHVLRGLLLAVADEWSHRAHVGRADEPRLVDLESRVVLLVAHTSCPVLS